MTAKTPPELDHLRHILTRDLGALAAEVRETPDDLLWESAPGITNPVGTLAIGTSGAKNAGLLAASIVALKDDAIRKRLEKWRAKQTSDVPENPTGQAKAPT